MFTFTLTPGVYFVGDPVHVFDVKGDVTLHLANQYEYRLINNTALMFPTHRPRQEDRVEIFTDNCKPLHHYKIGSGFISVVPLKMWEVNIGHSLYLHLMRVGRVLQLKKSATLLMFMPTNGELIITSTSNKTILHVNTSDPIANVDSNDAQ